MRFNVRVPASSANLGPGFDALAVALELFTMVDVVVNDASQIRVVDGPNLRGGPDLVLAGIQQVIEATGQSIPGCNITVHTDIPVARGLGSSAAAVVAGLVTGNHLLGGPLSADDLLQLATQMEGHGDNVSAALFGNVTLVAPGELGVVLHCIKPAGLLQAVIFIPEQTSLTEDARAVVPPQVPRSDAVANMACCALLVSALSTGEFDLLRVAMQDRLHQPYRANLFPFVSTLMQSATAAGAYGASLSGAGPAVLALVAPQRASVVAEAMGLAARRCGVEGQVRSLGLASRGAHVIAADTEAVIPHR